MKADLSILMAVLSVAIFVNSASAQQKAADEDEKRQQVTEMLQDSTMRSVVMERIAKDPQMRRQMMQHMRASMKSNQGMMKQRMSGMMQDTAMKAHRQEHRKMMRTMIDDPKMRQYMMQMHARCMEMMQDSTLMNQNKKDN